MTLTVPTIAATAVDQSIVYSVAYKGGTAKDAAAFTVAMVGEACTATAMNATGASVSLDGATGIVADSSRDIKITFVNELDSATTTRTNFKLYKGTSLVALGVPTLSTDKKTVTINPAADLVDSTEYKVVILTGLKNSDGTATLIAEKTITFTTGSAAYITAIQDDAAGAVNQTTSTNVAVGNVQNGDTFTFTLNKALDPSTVVNANIQLYDITGGTQTAVPIVVKPSTVTPAGNSSIDVDVAKTDDLTAGHQYKFVFGAVKDLLGTAVYPDQVTFTVGATQLTPTARQSDRATALAAATVWPKITAGSLDGSTAIQNPAKFYVSFDQTQAIDESTINSSTVYVNELDTNNAVVATVVGTVAYDSTLRMASFTPLADLKSNTSYKMTMKVGVNGIKDVLGLALLSATDITSTFTTYDVVAPSVSTVQLKVASGTDVTVESGVADVDSTKQLRFALNFNEAIAHVDNDGTNANYSTAAPTANNANTFAAGDTVLLVNSANNTAVNIAGTTSLSTDGKTMYVTLPAATLARGTSYTMKIAGKAGNPSGSAVTADAIADRTNTALGFENRMENMYSFSFSTVDADATAPLVSSIKVGATYATATAITTNAVNVSEAKNLYIVFNELMTTGNAKTSIDDNATGATTGDHNVQLLTKTVGGNWAVAAAGNSDNLPAGTETAGFIGFTDDAVNAVSYLTIATADIAADTNYKVLLTPAALANGIEDVALNDLAAQYSFEFATDGGMVFTPVTAGTVITASVGTLDAAIAAGDGAGAVEVDPSAAVVIANTDRVGIETQDGSMVFASADTAQTGGVAGGTTSLDGDLTVAAANGAMIVNFTNVAASFSDMSTGYVVSDPVAIRIDAVAADMVDLNTITTSTIKLVKVSDNTEVAAAISAVRGALGDALVAINPTANLENSTQYKVVVENVKSQLGNVITTKSTYFTTAAAAAPLLAVSSTTPSASAISVAVNSALTVTFNADISAQSLNATGPAVIAKGATTVAGTNALDTATPGAEDTIALHNITDGDYVTGRLSLSADGKTVTVIPNGLLEAGDLYTIELGSALESTTAGDLASTSATRTFSFNAEAVASVKPQITSARWVNANTPGTSSVTAGDLLIISFNTPMDAATVAVGAGDKDALFALDLGGTFDAGNNDSTAAWSTDSKTVTITLGTAPVFFVGSTTITGLGGVTDGQGNVIDLVTGVTISQ